MRLILQLFQSDGFTYDTTDTIPVEYESAEALFVDLLAAAHSALAADKDEFQFLGQSFAVHTIYRRESLNIDGNPASVVRVNGFDYVEQEVKIQTLDEFFAHALKRT